MGQKSDRGFLSCLRPAAASLDSRGCFPRARSLSSSQQVCVAACSSHPVVGVSRASSYSLSRAGPDQKGDLMARRTLGLRVLALSGISGTGAWTAPRHVPRQEGCLAAGGAWSPSDQETRAPPAPFLPHRSASRKPALFQNLPHGLAQGPVVLQVLLFPEKN